jgi:uncharacterized protein YgfB (UPF0149 family)
MFNTKDLSLPDYDAFDEEVLPLSLQMSPASLHGTLVGFIATGHANKAETYLNHMTVQTKQDHKEAVTALYTLFMITHTEFQTPNHLFHLFLPNDNAFLCDHAKAFTEWCDAFLQTLNALQIQADQFEEEDIKNGFVHLDGFASLDYNTIVVDNDDEKALMEIEEYTRIFVSHLYEELVNKKLFPVLNDEKTTKH